MTEDTKFAYQQFAEAAKAYHAAKVRHDAAFAQLVAAQDAERDAGKELHRAAEELKEAQNDLIAEIVGAPTTVEAEW